MGKKLREKRRMNVIKRKNEPNKEIKESMKERERGRKTE
jgi:hypothetical protein